MLRFAGKALLVAFVALSAIGSAQVHSGLPRTSWRYYRLGNTGIQGDFCEALYVAPDGNPYIAGYDPLFEEGGFSKFLQQENRWLNYSNVDYRVMGHPQEQGCIRVQDIVPDGTGRLWMATWRGALTFDPAVGVKSIARYGAANSGLTDDRVWDIDLAPDGTVWFANNGSARYNPATNAWSRWDGMGNVFMAVQPKPGGGYLVWSTNRPPFRDYTFVYDSATNVWTYTFVGYPFSVAGAVVGMPGKDCVDSSGNFWALRLTPGGDFDSLDYRRHDGTWVMPSEPYSGVTFSISAFKAYGDRRAIMVDGNGSVFQFDGSVWNNLGVWGSGGSVEAADIDANGNIWISGVGGAAKRDVGTGQWTRYRVTNTSNYDNFNRDLAIDSATGKVYTGANAAPGVGGMVSFDGKRWTGWNQLTYGLGHNWPFPNDYCEALAYRPSNGRIAVSPLDWLYGIHEWTGSGFQPLLETGGAVRMCEDSLGRLWTIGEYYSMSYFAEGTWTPVPIAGWGAKIQPDPSRPGAVWATTGNEIVRTDGIYRFSRSVGDFPELNSMSDQFTGLAADKNGIAWVGSWTQNYGPGNGVLLRLDSNTGSYRIYRNGQNWPFPGQYVRPLAVTPDGRLWMQYDGEYPSTEVGLCWWDGRRVGKFPAPPGGEPQWGGLPHAGIEDVEVRLIPGGYELWMSCVSRGIAVLTVRQPALGTRAPLAGRMLPR